MVFQCSITIKPVSTKQLYQIRDIEDVIKQLPDTVQILHRRYELDRKYVLHLHGVCEYTDRISNLKRFFGRGWHIHTSPRCDEGWIDYCSKAGSITTNDAIDYRSALEWYRRSDNLFID